MSSLATHTSQHTLQARYHRSHQQSNRRHCTHSCKHARGGRRTLGGGPGQGRRRLAAHRRTTPGPTPVTPESLAAAAQGGGGTVIADWPNGQARRCGPAESVTGAEWTAGEGSWLGEPAEPSPPGRVLTGLSEPPGPGAALRTSEMCRFRGSSESARMPSLEKRSASPQPQPQPQPPQPPPPPAAGFTASVEFLKTSRDAGFHVCRASPGPARASTGLPAPGPARTHRRVPPLGSRCLYPVRLPPASESNCCCVHSRPGTEKSLPG